MIEIPGYSIQKELGQGGMATVYLAQQESLQRPVALKVMAPALAADRTFSERFLREGRTIGQLSHPHIVAVYDIGVVAHHHYIAMEYLPSGDLKSRLKDNLPLEPREALTILRQIAQALGYAHDRGFVHRDVKPENILFREGGDVVLTDFGIAKSVSGNTRMTGTGMSIGTPHYMSPEQARGKKVDGRADLYSLGVVFYEMLTGFVPYDAEDSLAIGIKHITEPVPKLPSQLQRWQPVLDCLMTKNPEERIQSSQELLAFIENGVHNSVARRRVSSATRVMRNVEVPEKHRQSNSSGLFWGIGGAVMAGSLALTLYWIQELRKPVIRGGGASSSVSVRHIERDISGVNTTRVDFQKNRSETGEVSIASNQEEINKLLKSAKANMEVLNLTDPTGNNALEKYRRILELDQENWEAKKGLQNIVERYLQLAKSSIEQNLFDQAQNYLDKASSVGVLRGQIRSSRLHLKEVRLRHHVEQQRLVALKSDSSKKTQPTIRPKPDPVKPKPIQSESRTVRTSSINNYTQKAISQLESNIRLEYASMRWVQAYAQFGKIEKEYKRYITSQSLTAVKNTILDRLQGKPATGTLPRLVLKK